MGRYTFQDLLGESPTFRSAVELAKKFARTDLTVLLEGERSTQEPISDLIPILLN